MREVNKYLYDFPRPALTADVVVYDPNLQKFLMIERSDTGQWAHAGGFVDIGEGERVHECAVRELKEETNLDARAEQLMLIGLFDEPERDPRTRTVSTCYLYFHTDEQHAIAGDDAKNLAFYSLDELTIMNMQNQIAFDHWYMIHQTLQFLQAMSDYQKGTDHEELPK